MLRVCGVTQAPEENVRVDDYVPLIVEWGVQRGGNVYWRSGVEQSSLHELGIELQTGRVSSFTLTLVGPALRTGGWIDLTGVPAQPGLPVVDLGSWPPGDWENGLAYVTDDPNPFLVHLSDDAVCVAFGDLSAVAEALSTGRSHFLLGRDGELIGIEVRRLTPAEMQAMRSTLAHASHGQGEPAVQTDFSRRAICLAECAPASLPGLSSRVRCR